MDYQVELVLDFKVFDASLILYFKLFLLYLYS